MWPAGEFELLILTSCRINYWTHQVVRGNICLDLLDALHDPLSQVEDGVLVRLHWPLERAHLLRSEFFLKKFICSLGCVDNKSQRRVENGLVLCGLWAVLEVMRRNKHLVVDWIWYLVFLGPTLCTLHTPLMHLAVSPAGQPQKPSQSMSSLQAHSPSHGGVVGGMVGAGVVVQSASWRLEQQQKHSILLAPGVVNACIIHLIEGEISQLRVSSSVKNMQQGKMFSPFSQVDLTEFERHTLMHRSPDTGSTLACVRSHIIYLRMKGSPLPTFEKSSELELCWADEHPETTRVASQIKYVILGAIFKQSEYDFFVALLVRNCREDSNAR